MTTDMVVIEGSIMRLDERRLNLFAASRESGLGPVQFPNQMPNIFFAWQNAGNCFACFNPYMIAFQEAALRIRRMTARRYESLNWN